MDIYRFNCNYLPTMFDEARVASREILTEALPMTRVVRQHNEIPSTLETAIDASLLTVPVNQTYAHVYSQPADSSESPTCYYTDLRDRYCSCEDYRYRRVESNERCKHLWRVLAEILAGRIPPLTVNPYMWLTTVTKHVSRRLEKAIQSEQQLRLPPAELDAIQEELRSLQQRVDTRDTSVTALYVQWFTLYNMLTTVPEIYHAR